MQVPDNMDMSYSQFMGKLKAKNIGLNRKVLADLAMNDPKAFEAIVKKLNKANNLLIFYSLIKKLSGLFF